MDSPVVKWVNSAPNDYFSHKQEETLSKDNAKTAAAIPVSVDKRNSARCCNVRHMGLASHGCE